MTLSAGSGIGRAVRPAFVVIAVLAAAGAADVRAADRTGKEVVDAVCVACHATGKDNAPKIGDEKAWAGRASQGLTALTAHALTGIRNMPAHGGSPGVSDREIERAIVYMVNQSGGHWIVPIDASAPVTARSSEAIVQAQCAKCHQTGVDGAPKIGDRAAWIPRLSQGLDKLVASAVHGHGAMPARGGMPDLSDAEIRGAIDHMFNYGIPKPPPAPAATGMPRSPNHQIVGGTDVYLGMMRASMVRPDEAPMQPSGDRHMPIPSGKGYYHVNISLTDHGSQKPVTDAQVTVTVTDGMTSTKLPLGRVAANNTVSYGNFFRLDSGSQYRITASIERPGQPVATDANFDFKAP